VDIWVHMDITALFAHSAVVVVAGKGGVGKTTVSAVVARLAARHGLSVLLVELDGKSGLSAAFGNRLWTGAEVELARAGSDASRNRSVQIRARTLTAEDALARYLIDHGWRWVAKRLANAGTLDVVATAIPGVRDILMLGQIAQLERAGAADLIVVDGPAAGHATTFLTSAHGLLDASRAGPVRAQAAKVMELLSDPARCQVALVTLAEETAVNETVETAVNLEDRVGTHLGPVIVNGLYPRLDHLDADPDDAAAAAGVTLHPDQADAMRAAAAFRRRREELQAEQTARLAQALPLPQLWLPQLFAGEIGLSETDLLADALETGLVHLRQPPGRASRAGPTEPTARNREPGPVVAGTGVRS
jgi:anion-transporting  ArsA/GET3 family ATPase